MKSITIYGAEDFGKLMGEVDGYLDYKAGKKNNWEKSIPSNRELDSLFELKLESSEYREGFIEFLRKHIKLHTKKPSNKLN